MSDDIKTFRGGHLRDPDLWHNADMLCQMCGKRWIATYPDIAGSLECPDCQYRNRRPDKPEPPPRSVAPHIPGMMNRTDKDWFS